MIFAIPDHPWADGGAAVTVAMTGVELNDCKKNAKSPMLGCLINDGEGDLPEDKADRVKLRFKAVDLILSNLKTGIDVTKAHSLKSNSDIASKGFELGGIGFQLDRENLKILETEIIHPFLTGRDLAQSPEERYVIDVNHLSEQELELKYPKTYQWLIENVKPVRDINNDLRLRREWWRYRRSNAIMRDGIQDLDGYILTPRTAKHRCFTFRSKNVLPESEIIVIFLDDMYDLGVLSSKTHVTWALAAGGDLGGNTPRYNNTVCFDPFPFPTPTDTQKQIIRELGERLDSHRKRVQATHPEVTITGMYNLLEKLRNGEPLDDKDKAFNQKALVSTLKQIHDELDAAVFAAYGWELTLTDEQILENLVTLNAQRAAEERNGHIRWLRPDYQNPGETHVQQTLEGITTETETAITPAEQLPFPKTLKEQLSAIRDLFRTQSGEWTAAQITAHFKGANRKQKVILDCLESLEDLGILLSHTENGMTFWHLAEL